MSKRSNEFQKLIYLLERQLAVLDVQKVRVTESKEILDSNGILREIDVAIEGEFAGYRLLIAVECHDHKRKGTLKWVDEVIGKYKDTHVNKIILVSRNGFVRNAIRKAKKHNIELYSLGDPHNQTWARSLKVLSNIEVESTFPVGEFVFTVHIPPGDNYKAGPKDMLFKPGGGKWATLEEVKNQYLDRNDFYQALRTAVYQKSLQNQTIAFEVMINFEKGTYCLRADGVKQHILGLVITGKCHTKVFTVGGKRASYRDSEIVYAKDDIGKGYSFLLSAISKKGYPTTMSVEVFKDGK